MKAINITKIGQTVLLAFLYFIAGKFALMLAIPPGYASPIWPAEGIAVVCIAFWGYQVWPGVLIGSMALNWTPGAHFSAVSWESLIIPFFIGSGSTLAAVFAVYRLSRLGFPEERNLEKVNFLQSFLCAGPCSCLISATIGVTTLYFSGAVKGGEFMSSWLTWWVGDSLGVLICLSLVMSGSHLPRISNITTLPPVERFTVGTIVLLTGVLVLFGWLWNIPHLTTLTPHQNPMLPNAAIAFIFCGVSIYGTASGKKMLSLIGASFPLFIGFATCFEYIFKLDLGIDQLFIHVNVPELFPGRIAPNSALAFLLFGLAMVIRLKLSEWKYLNFAIALIGVFILAIGIIPLIAFMAGMETSHGWGKFSRMAIPTAFLWSVLGLKFFRLSWISSTSSQRKLPVWLPTVATVGSITMTIFLWYVMVQNDKLHVRDLTQTIARNVHRNIERRLVARVQGLEEMGERWELRGSIPYKEWESDVKLYQINHPVFQAISWVDPLMVVRWIYPVKGNEIVQNVYLGNDALRREMMEKGKATDESQFSGCINLAQGGKGFIVSVPINVPDGKNGFLNKGFINGVFRIDRFMDSVIDDGVVANYDLKLFENGNQIYSTNPASSQGDSAYTVTMPFVYKGHTWLIQLSPREALLMSGKSRVCEFLLVLGLFISILVVASIHFAQRSEWFAAEAVRAEQRLNNVLESAEVGGWDIDLITGKVLRTKHHATIFGYSDHTSHWSYEDLLGHILPEDLSYFKQELQKAHNGKGVFDLEFRINRTDGAIRWIVVKGRVFFDAAGNPVRRAGIIADITERKQAEAELRAANQSLAEKMQELEKLNKIMMGREERILELKEEIKKLKAKADQVLPV